MVLYPAQRAVLVSIARDYPDFAALLAWQYGFHSGDLIAQIEAIPRHSTTVYHLLALIETAWHWSATPDRRAEVITKISATKRAADERKAAAKKLFNQ